jgi:succinate dehydrogenase/fumarate reductase flavoprotein subunit
MQTDRWESSANVIVVGSGAAGLSAAISAFDRGAGVEIIEAAPMIGGTSSISGGQPWVPMNRHLFDAGREDSREEALTYLYKVTHGRAPDESLLETFVDRAAEAFAYLEENTPLKFKLCESFSDYHADLPGGKMAGHRTLDAVPFNARAALGELDEKVRRSPHLPSLTIDELAGVGMAANPKDAASIIGGTGELGAEARRLIAEREKAGVRACGGALVTSLLRGVLDRGMQVRTSTRVRRLLIEDGAVVGVVAETADGETAFEARRGVVLAAGGFEWNEDLVKAFLGVPKVWPITPPYNRGDALQMGLRAGAAVANMTVAFACPVTSDGQDTWEGQPLHMMNSPRQEPGVIAVNRNGRRFSNEAIAYMHFGLAFRVFDPVQHDWPNQSPVWLVFDQRVRDRTAAKDLVPGRPTPSWVKEASTIEELAGQMDVPANELVATVKRWNTFVANGADEDFGRATVWFEGLTSGGPDPERMLAPIDKPSYYAMALYDGTVGTAGGLRIDPDGRVKTMDGGVIPGLYAAGNTTASVFGPAYPGGGGTLGLAMTFGYLAGLNVAELPGREGGAVKTGSVGV